MKGAELNYRAVRRFAFAFAGAIVCCPPLSSGAPLRPAPSVVSFSTGGAVVRAQFSLPQVRTTADGLVEVTLTNAFPSEQAGQPVLPRSVVSVDLPEGVTVTGCRATAADPVSIPLSGRVRHGRAAAAYSIGPGAPSAPDPATYALDTPYPPLTDTRWSIERRGTKRVLNIRLTPVQYVPSAGVLLANRRMEVAVTWSASADGGAGSIRDAQAAGAGTPLTSGALSTTGRFDYVVITSADLLGTPPPYNFQSLCATRNRDGFVATNVTVEWIYANYSGARPDGGTDNPTRIRNFIIDAHQNWGTRFVLLGGGVARVPTRLLYGLVQSSAGTMNGPVASDLYYGCLDGTFDSNANGVYGEAEDGAGAPDIDLVAEVYVGRFPVETTYEVANMVRKTLAYEAASPDQLRRISHLGEWMGFGGVAEYATATMEQLRLGGSYDGYTTVGFGNASNAASFDISDTLYDTAGYRWPNTEVVNRFQQDFHVFNHLGHGNWEYCFRLDSESPGDVNAMLGLTNSSYFLAYSQACDAGRFDEHSDCLAETLVTATNGPAAVIMNTRYGWGAIGSTDGPSQRYHRHFWDELLGGDAYLLGEANQKSKEALRYLIDDYGGAMRWCYFELTLFGDPALPFGARISPLPPTIGFVPLPNRRESTDIRVECSFGPPGLYDPDSPQLVWRTSVAPDQVHTTVFSQVVGTLHAAGIPAQPAGTVVGYSIHVASRSGMTASLPGGGAEYSLPVTPTCVLAVSGDPLSAGTVAPPYGVSLFASGNTVQASACLREVLPDGHARRCGGWSGTGSVPSAGASNGVSFVIGEDSSLVWQWVDENALVEHTSPDGLFFTNVWCAAGTTTGTVTAASRLAYAGSNFCFAGWYLDGVRCPVTGGAANPVGNIAMDQPHDVTALYIPEAQDADGDQVPDWWELYWYGTMEYGAADDTDGDGAGLLFEYLAGTDPTDSSSFPQSPAIAVVPLAPVQTVPPPYPVSVQITDTSPLVITELVWQKNSGICQSNALVVAPSATNAFVGTITGAAASGDTFAYWVVAVGRDGLSAQSATNTTHLQYAVISLQPPLSRAYNFIPPGPMGDWLTVSNSGTSTLAWHAYAGFGEYADAPPSPDWNLAASSIPWVWTTARCSSVSGSLHATIVSPVPARGVGQHACMTTPALRLGAGAWLAFRYWIASELDDTQAGHCWDGGIVEVSTNGGLTFGQLPGPYTCSINGWWASPWPDGTPCFAGTGDGWHEATFDLSAFAGTNTLLRFNYGADDNTDREGWYVDDIRIAPLAPEDVPGTAFAPASGSVLPGATESLVVAVDTAQCNRRWLRVPVLIRSNDPVTPAAWYELAFDVRHAPALSLAAAQSTNGDGIVTISGALIDPDGESHAITFDYSCDDGATWSAPRFGNVTFDHGTGTLQAVAGAVDFSVPPSQPLYATNCFVLSWNTQNPSNHVSLSMGTLLRVRATDPCYATACTLATPFPIDNQPPDTPALHVFTPLPQTWSATRRLTFNWDTSDGAGVGLQDSRVTLSRPGEGTNAITVAYATPPALVSLDCDADSSNWWLTVQARDRMGNASTSAVGPFWIDTTPPVAGQACVATNLGRFGNYVVVSRVPLAGVSFTDALSGVAGYTFENTTRPDVLPVTTAGARLDWADVVWGRTNTFRITAVDRAGNRSEPSDVSVLVLDPLQDADGDGVRNGDEERIGSSPFVPSPPFAVTQTSVDTGAWVTLRWPSVAGSRYTVDCAGHLTGGTWGAVTGFENLPGTDGVMSVSIPVQFGTSFFRVRITP